MLGTSDSRLDLTVRHLLRVLQARTVLELGCGRGKFAKIYSEACAISGGGLVHGVQRLFSTEERETLRALGYQKIIDRDILDHYREGFDERYQLIVALDVIEHFLLADAMSIIAFSLYRADWMLLVWPSEHPQDADTSVFDRHRCSFGLRELAAQFDVVYYNQTGFAALHYQHRYHVALLRGYMNHAVLPPIGA